MDNSKEIGKEEVCCFGCFVICSLFGGLLLWVVIRHNDRSIERPNIYVNSASVNPSFLTAVWNFTFVIQNPNKKFAMPFINGFDFNVSYGKDVLSRGSIGPFELKKKESNLVKATMNTLPATLSEEAAKRMEDELRTSKVVNFHITIKGLMQEDTNTLLGPRCMTTHCENLKMLFSSDWNQSAGKMPGPSKCQVLCSKCHVW